MKVVVCIKIVQGEVNPFDAAALEAALRLENAQITVLCMGPGNMLAPLERLTRLGTFHTILVSDPIFAGSDTLATSHVLACVIRKLEPDLVLCGRQSIDGETAQVGPCLATMLGYSLITNVMRFATDICETRIGRETVERPALLTLERIHTLRFPSLSSKVKEVEIRDNRQVGADPARCGLKGSPTRVLETFESDRGRRQCRFIDRGELEPLLEDLLRRTSSRHRATITRSPVRFRRIWTVGNEVREQALAIADEVVALEKEAPERIAEKARRERPEVILWNADLWGRKTAPQVAALLETGLCADCTSLETDGERLLMYRPACAGNVIAKIDCRTRPQMATVRTAESGTNLVVSCGRGAADDFRRIESYAAGRGAVLGASRGLVDMGIAPYDIQVGLTGKSVSPKIYLAVGISGAVHHLCAVENAETIIAINKDRNARIFEYADYGIVDEF